MFWSIYKDTASNDINDWEECDVAFFFDMDIDASPENRVKFMHDGNHVVYFGKTPCVLTVVNGKFDITAAKKAIGEAVRTEGYHGQFIERFYRRDGKFEVAIGS